MGSDEALSGAVEGRDAEVRLFTAAILTGNYAAARSLLHAAFGNGLGHVYDRIVVPALAEVGERWYRNQITVADEHLASAVAQAAVASLYPLVQWPAGGGPRAVVGCADPELHTFGARMVADILALDGWRTTFVCGGISLASGLAGVDPREVRLYALSITLDAHVPAARVLIRRLREEAPGVKILAGGRAVAAQPDAARLLGADAVATSASLAVGIARAWR
ncbi:B12-binding domain-containing protein [Sorangium sp. So ce1128]